MYLEVTEGIKYMPFIHELSSPQSSVSSSEFSVLLLYQKDDNLQYTFKNFAGNVPFNNK